MHTTLARSGSPVTSFADLLKQYGDGELASPRRSTVPLLSYWRHPDARLQEFASALGLPIGAGAELHFEYHVPVQQGRGKASCTDLLLRSGDVAVAVEAKWTEPRYETVETWLGGQASGNRSDVLNGWLGLLSARGDNPLTPEAVSELPYQLIHRAASACHPKASARWLVYHIFSNGAASDEYKDDLTMLKPLLESCTSMHIRLVRTEVASTARHDALLARWDNGERQLSDEVRHGLVEDDLLRVGPSQVTVI